MELSDELKAALAAYAWTTDVPPKPLQTWGAEYARWRFLKALHDSPSAVLDQMVLLRQVLRWTRLSTILPVLPPCLSRETLARVGLLRGDSGALRAVPFRPSWWEEGGEPHESCLDPAPRPELPPESIAAEPWLSTFANHDKWRSAAQKEACWGALIAPRDSTNLIGLPTGSGKSLVFQLLARFCTGLTIVVVPTVALALDHARSSQRLFADLPQIKPLHYEAEARAAAVARTAIQDRTCRLLFVSPEACTSGALNSILDEAARNGWLENIVIDEAHIVESWGGDFRVDFQVLASLIEEWRDLSHRGIRLTLLSATFSPACREVLRELFAVGSTQWREFVSQRLRPEMHYFLQSFKSRTERQSAVLDCIYQMPRPAIVYTTEVNDARELYRIVAEEHGFQRVGCFHGDTPSEDRLRLLSEWQNDKIDLMVATSAFGLGVDKNDVRTVVHACAPESVDRYYQEVGRGGRDGASASCVFLPSSRDWHIAKRLTPRLIGDKKLRLRWNAMWQQRQSVSDAERNLFDLPLDVKHAELYGARSYDKNIQWNKRLLLLLVRAGHLRIVGAPWREHASAYEGAFSHWVRVELRFNPLDDVARLIHTQRDKELQGSARALKQISSYVTTGIPICRVLQRQYSYEAQRACGSCHACRHGQANPASCPALIGPTLTKTTPSVALVLGAPDFTTINGRNDVIDLIRRVVQKMWIKRFLCTVAEREMVTSCFRDAFGTKDRILYRIDSVDSEVSVGITPEETLICVHVGGYSAALEAANQFGKAVIHWVAHRHVVLDGNGRLPLIAGGAAHYSSVEQWLSAANA